MLHLRLLDQLAQSESLLILFGWLVDGWRWEGCCSKRRKGSIMNNNRPSKQRLNWEQTHILHNTKKQTEQTCLKTNTTWQKYMKKYKYQTWKYRTSRNQQLKTPKHGMSVKVSSSPVASRVSHSPLGLLSRYRATLIYIKTFESLQDCFVHRHPGLFPGQLMELEPKTTWHSAFSSECLLRWVRAFIVDYGIMTWYDTIRCHV